MYARLHSHGQRRLHAQAIGDGVAAVASKLGRNGRLAGFPRMLSSEPPPPHDDAPALARTAALSLPNHHRRRLPRRHSPPNTFFPTRGARRTPQLHPVAAKSPIQPPKLTQSAPTPWRAGSGPRPTAPSMSRSSAPPPRACTPSFHDNVCSWICLY